MSSTKKRIPSKSNLNSLRNTSPEIDELTFLNPTIHRYLTENYTKLNQEIEIL